VAPSAFASLSGPPAGSGGPGGPGGGPDNRKLIIGFLSAVGALLLILVLVLLYAFVIRDDKTTQITSPGSSTPASKTTTSTESSVTSTASETTESPAPTAGAQATEGDFAFSVASTDSGDTVTSPINEYIEKTANGEFFVVYLNVGNSGSAPLTFQSTLQQLKADADTFAPDDEASLYLGGGVATINPGEQVETAVAFDVPVGTTPTSIQVHGEPGGVGVELPL
jgi:cytoskeletal protein RodZ